MTSAERRLVNELLERDREIAASAAEVARLRAFLEAAEVCTFESDRNKVVRLAIGAPD